MVGDSGISRNVSSIFSYNVLSALPVSLVNMSAVIKARIILVVEIYPPQARQRLAEYVLSALTLAIQRQQVSSMSKAAIRSLSKLLAAHL